MAALAVNVCLNFGIFGIAMALTASVVNDVPPLPDLPKSNQAKRIFYFAATATDSIGSESDYSSELVWTNGGTNIARLLKLGWGAPICTNLITNYTIYQGRQIGFYTNTVDAGTNLTAWIRILPAIKSNCIVSLSASCTNWASFTLTNPGAALFVRANSTKGSFAWTVHAEAANSIDGPWVSFSGIWTDWFSAVKPNVTFSISEKWE